MMPNNVRCQGYHMMRHDFDLFQKLADGSSIWRTCASGQIDAQQKLQNLADHSESEFYSIDIETGELLPFNLARCNYRNQLKRAASSLRYKKCSATWKNSQAKRSPQMKRKYDLFEKCPDGLSLWRDSVFGYQLTRRRLQALAQISENQYYAIDLTTGEVLAFNSEHAMLMDCTQFQKLKDEAIAMLLRYGKDDGRIMGEDQMFVCSPQWVN